MKILSCDLETTGLRPCQDDWITGSFGILDFDTLETIDELEIEARPNNWNEEAFAIHKIRKATAMKFPPRKEALQELIEFVPNEDFFFLSHSRPYHQDGSFYHFDFAFLKMDFTYQLSIFEFWKYFNDQNNISTDTIAVDLRKRGFDIPKSTSLVSLCDHFGIKFQHHNAKSDRLAMEKVLGRLRDAEKTRTFLI